jgi:hypothetical protein
MEKMPSPAFSPAFSDGPPHFHQVDDDACLLLEPGVLEGFFRRRIRGTAQVSSQVERISSRR